MKMARYLSVTTLGVLLASTGAEAGPSSTPLKNSLSGVVMPVILKDSNDTAPEENPDAQFDPDGVPLSVSHPDAQLSDTDLAAYRQQLQQAALDKDWLLRDYEQELQHNAKTNPSNNQSNNLYYQLSTNKDLAKLAGLENLDTESQESTTSVHPGAVLSGPSAVTLRSDASQPQFGGPVSHASLFQPLVTPLGATEAAGMHNFYTSLPLSMPSPLAADIPQAVASSSADEALDTTDLDTPGMVAAQKDPVEDTTSADLSLDILPGETPGQARAREENNNNLELPLPMDADQLHKAQDASLSATTPGTSNTLTKTAAPLNATPPANNAAAQDPEAPTPVSKLTPISPVRAPIASPYDILDR